MALPTLPALITIPEFFSPSALVHAKACRLRALASHLDRSVMLHGGPAAERGVLFHALLENAARGRIPRGSSARADAQRLLEALLVSARTRLAADPATSAYADLSQTLPAVHWRNVCGRMIDAAARLSERAPPAATPSNPISAYELDLRRLERASEVPIRAPALRIAGRIDFLERNGPARLTVSDYKTGSVLEQDGTIRPEVALQLRLYGLAVSDLLPSIEVTLVVSAGIEHEVPFKAEDMAATRRWLEEVVESLPAGVSVAPESLASPGSACRKCPVRPACAAYMREAPNLWANGTSGFVLPFDTWGRVNHLEADPQRGMSVRLRDAAGRLVRVTRLVTRLQYVDFKDSPIWLFGLEAAVPPAVGGRSMHPRNFHELPGSPLERRAWTLAAFC